MALVTTVALSVTARAQLIDYQMSDVVGTPLDLTTGAGSAGYPGNWEWNGFGAGSATDGNGQFVVSNITYAASSGYITCDFRSYPTHTKGSYMIQHRIDSWNLVDTAVLDGMRLGFLGTGGEVLSKEK